MRKKLYFGGLTIIIISFIVCVISFWWLFYGIPAFILGSVLVIFSNQTTKNKLLVTLLPIILYFPFTYLFLTAYNYTTPKIFLIPSNYEGTLRIIYEEECGQNIYKKDIIINIFDPKPGLTPTTISFSFLPIIAGPIV